MLQVFPLKNNPKNLLVEDYLTQVYHRGNSKPLPQEKPVLKTTRMAEKNWSQILRIFEEQTQQGFIRRGMKPVRLSDADIKYFQELSQKLREDLAGKLYPRELLDEILQLKKEFSEKALQEIYK